MWSRLMSSVPFSREFAARPSGFAVGTNSNGANGYTGGGAGGSIRIDADALSGGGEIRADGGPTFQAAGGGGRIAVY